MKKILAREARVVELEPEIYLFAWNNAHQWASKARMWRVRGRIRDYESWMTSCNGDHRITVEASSLGWLDGMRAALRERV